MAATRSDDIDDGQATDPRPWWRRRIVGIVAVVGLCALASWGAVAWLTRPRPPDYTGRTVAATFAYDCTNGIFWDDPSTEYAWWAGFDPDLPTDLDTSSPTGDSPLPYHHTTGQLHFDDATRATFTSDAGGTLDLTRQPPGQMYLASCGMPNN